MSKILSTGVVQAYLSGAEQANKHCWVRPISPERLAQLCRSHEALRAQVEELRTERPGLELSNARDTIFCLEEERDVLRAQVELLQKVGKETSERHPDDVLCEIVAREQLEEERREVAALRAQVEDCEQLLCEMLRKIGPNLDTHDALDFDEMLRVSDAWEAWREKVNALLAPVEEEGK